MQLSEMQVMIGDLVSDPNHDRYSLTQIGTELDNSMDTWNIEAKIIKDTVNVTLTANIRQYALSLLTGTPISFPRTTHKGIDLSKRSKTYFDHLGPRDWTLDLGTPTDFFIEATDLDNQFISLYPNPQGNDVDQPVVVEYVKRHTPMSAASDTPFMSVTSVNYLLRPFDWGLCYSVASKLLLRDPSTTNAAKSSNFASIAQNVLSEVVQVFKALEAEEPKRIAGGRYWNTSNVRMVK